MDTTRTLKDPKLVTSADVCTSLALTQAQDEVSAAINVAAVKPDNLMNHAIADSYTLLGITPEEFLKTHGADTFDFNKLKEEFSKICTDYYDPLESKKPSYALQFCALVLYKIAPASRQVKAKTGDKTWVLKFTYSSPEKKIIVKTCFISTYKAEGAEYTPSLNGDKITVSVKHASLLALVTLEKMVGFALKQAPPIVILTPLSGAIYCRQDIPLMAAHLNITPLKTINAINASCQSGGQYLESSNLACAAAAAIIATQNLRAKGKPAMANNIVTKTIKQYLNAKKGFNEENFVTYSTYATGGIPGGMSAKDLIKLFNAAKEAAPKLEKPRKVREAITDTELTAAKEQMTGPYLVNPNGEDKYDVYELSELTKASKLKKKMGGRRPVEPAPDVDESDEDDDFTSAGSSTQP